MGTPFTHPSSSSLLAHKAAMWMPLLLNKLHFSSMNPVDKSVIKEFQWSISPQTWASFFENQFRACIHPWNCCAQYCRSCRESLPTSTTLRASISMCILQYCAQCRETAICLLAIPSVKQTRRSLLFEPSEITCSIFIIMWKSIWRLFLITVLSTDCRRRVYTSCIYLMKKIVIAVVMVKRNKISHYKLTADTAVFNSREMWKWLNCRARKILPSSYFDMMTISQWDKEFRLFTFRVFIPSGC